MSAATDRGGDDDGAAEAGRRRAGGRSLRRGSGRRARRRRRAAAEEEEEGRDDPRVGAAAPRPAASSSRRRRASSAALLLALSVLAAAAAPTSSSPSGPPPSPPPPPPPPPPLTRRPDRRPPAAAAAAAPDRPPPSPLAALSGGGRPPKPPPQPRHRRAIELYENEHYDPSRRAWLGRQPRWTSPSGGESPAPADLQPPRGHRFESEWKIDVTGGGTRDHLGWEYLWDAAGRAGRRRRRWLRTLAPIERKADVGEAAAAAAATTAAKKATPRRRSRRPPRLDPLRPARAALDNFNFKGFGWSFYKSLIFPAGCGVSLRLPMSVNFDWYERRPALPSVSSSVSIYYPNWTAAVFLSFSVQMSVVRFALLRTWEWAAYLAAAACVLAKAAAYVATFPVNALLRAAWEMASGALGDDGGGGDAEAADDEARKRAGGGTAMAVLGYPLPSPPPRRRIRYSADVEERVGMSVSWRLSERRGYEFRVSYYHLYLTTLMFLGGLVGRALDRAAAAAASGGAKRRDRAVEAGAGSDGALLADAGADAELEIHPGEERRPGGMNLFRNDRLVDCLRRRTGSLGLIWGGITPDPPHLTCSAVLSLSGFYYDHLLRRRRRRRGGRRSSAPPAAAFVLPSGRRSPAATAAATADESPSSTIPSGAAARAEDAVAEMEGKILAGRERAAGALEEAAAAAAAAAGRKSKKGGGERSAAASGGGPSSAEDGESDGRGAESAASGGGSDEVAKVAS